jgi:hypothetical protein
MPVNPRHKNREALGRSRGGLTSKIHLLADSGCRPLARVTSSGQRHDSLAFEPLMGQLRIARRGPGRPRTRPGRVLGDKAYSSSAIRAHLRARSIKATIPQPSDHAERLEDLGRQRRVRRRSRAPNLAARAAARPEPVHRAPLLALIIQSSPSFSLFCQEHTTLVPESLNAGSTHSTPAPPTCRALPVAKSTSQSPSVPLMLPPSATVR